MAGNRNFNNRQGYNDRRQQKYELDSSKKIKIPLTRFYEDEGKTYLIGGTVYQQAQKLVQLPNTQLRKILDTTKQAVDAVKTKREDVDIARKVLFSMLPMTAYNASRAAKGEKAAYFELLQFLYNNLNEQTLINADDIIVFDRVFTSVIAYHKCLKDKEFGGEK